jgi:hypothetical protein
MIQKGDIECYGNMSTKSIKVADGKDFSLLNFFGQSFTTSNISANKLAVTDLITPILIPNNETRTLYVNLI